MRSNQWQALCRYTQDGRLTIDNNVSERRLRDQAIGRKNWLFLGSDEAGPRAAVICTIIAGAKRHRLEPWAYLNDVILELSVDASPESLERLLPDRWAAADPEHVLNHRLDESRQKAQRRDQRRAEQGAARDKPTNDEEVVTLAFPFGPVPATDTWKSPGVTVPLLFEDQGRRAPCHRRRRSHSCRSGT